MGYYTSDEIRKARNKFYPGWWKYEGLPSVNENLKPLYRVVCQNAQEWTLAWASKPEFVRAKILFELKNNIEEIVD